MLKKKIFWSYFHGSTKFEHVLSSKDFNKIVKMFLSLEMTRRNLIMKSTSWKFAILVKWPNFIERCVLTRFLFHVLWRLFITLVVIFFCDGSHFGLWCQKKFSQRIWTQSDHRFFFPWPKRNFYCQNENGSKFLRNHSIL